MESFYRTHTYLVEHVSAPVRRGLMDEIDWDARMIGIKGTRGVGKTTFLLQYAKERFGSADRQCLYVNMNNFYFQGRGIADFARDFVARGGKVLLIDQVFKQPDWSAELRRCYDTLPGLRIVFTGSSVMRLKEENAEIGGIVKSYNLRGFSFREFLNLKTGNHFPAHTLDDIMAGHEQLTREILAKAAPKEHFQDYIHHGFYPFFLEKRNFSENLLKTMNMITEVDILLIKQIELKYLTKIKKLFYLLAVGAGKAPNISQLAQEIETSRATVMNYIKYLADARLLNIIYPVGEEAGDDPDRPPRKPAKVMLHNPNLMYAIYPMQMERQQAMETFFVNALWKDHTVSGADKEHTYIVDGNRRYVVADALAQRPRHVAADDDTVYVRYNTEVGRGNMVPLWLMGFLY